jgi:NTP pyrophosphatase (non-canonical NTP hydrolase)
MTRTCRDLGEVSSKPSGHGAGIGILLWIQKENAMLGKLTEQFEAASADYVETHGMVCDADWFLLKLPEEMGELTQAWNRATGRGRKKGRSDEDLARDLADETADLLGHVLLFARNNRIDLASAIERKWLFRPEEG